LLGTGHLPGTFPLVIERHPAEASLPDKIASQKTPRSMPRLGVSRLLPHRPEQLFDIAADVERYPEFLPWWLSATIRRREVDVYYTDQVVGSGPIRERFSTRTVLRRPREIEVTSIDGPFEIFHLTWRFRPLQNEQCEVSLAGEIELRGLLLRNAFGWAIGGSADSILSAFEDRARRLCGARRR
jgi:coenzyme Q-binding protein COQ10